MRVGRVVVGGDIRVIITDHQKHPRLLERRPSASWSTPTRLTRWSSWTACAPSVAKRCKQMRGGCGGGKELGRLR